MKALPCKVGGCGRPKALPSHFCKWHWLLRQSPDDRVAEAERAFANRHDEAIVARVPERLWPPRERWCAGCQRFVPIFYTTGSRCKGCASKASHASHLERTYGISREDYERLLAYQGGRCAICGQKPGAGRRLAVDHDHKCAECGGAGCRQCVRGLLCASDQYGCNVTMAIAINDPSVAARLYNYSQRSPWKRLTETHERTPAHAPDCPGCDWISRTGLAPE